MENKRIDWIYLLQARRLLCPLVIWSPCHIPSPHCLRFKNPTYNPSHSSSTMNPSQTQLISTSSVIGLTIAESSRKGDGRSITCITSSSPCPLPSYVQIVVPSSFALFSLRRRLHAPFTASPSSLFLDLSHRCLLVLFEAPAPYYNWMKEDDKNIIDLPPQLRLDPGLFPFYFFFVIN